MEAELAIHRQYTFYLGGVASVEGVLHSSHSHSFYSLSRFEVDAAKGVRSRVHAAISDDVGDSIASACPRDLYRTISSEWTSMYGTRCATINTVLGASQMPAGLRAASEPSRHPPLSSPRLLMSILGAVSAPGWVRRLPATLIMLRLSAANAPRYRPYAVGATWDARISPSAPWCVARSQRGVPVRSCLPDLHLLTSADPAVSNILGLRFWDGHRRAYMRIPQNFAVAWFYEALTDSRLRHLLCERLPRRSRPLEAVWMVHHCADSVPVPARPPCLAVIRSA
ncbi:hypothetical protein FB451DRAFT_1411479 [Mycena latifolia]|nr:hypothetical protein FB451DRAFT_1411479 [Mycena latifolia]